MAERLTPLTSRIDALKRQLFDALQNPADYASMLGGRVVESGQAAKALQSQAFADPRQPFKVTDENALRQLTDMMMAGPMGFAPVGSVKIGQGLTKLKEDAKRLDIKEFLDKHVTQFMPEHMNMKSPPEGVVKQEPHEYLPPGLLDPSEWSSWADRSLPGSSEKIKSFRESLKRGDKFPPVLVHTQKGDLPYVEDGHHRMAAYIEEGVKEVPVSFDINSLIKIWKEQNNSQAKTSSLYQDYLQTLK
jgi:hypothetical protein